MEKIKSNPRRKGPSIDRSSLKYKIGASYVARIYFNPDNDEHVRLEYVVHKDPRYDTPELLIKEAELKYDKAREKGKKLSFDSEEGLTECHHCLISDIEEELDGFEDCYQIYRDRAETKNLGFKVDKNWEKQLMHPKIIERKHKQRIFNEMKSLRDQGDEDGAMRLFVKIKMGLRDRDDLFWYKQAETNLVDLNLNKPIIKKKLTDKIREIEGN